MKKLILQIVLLLTCSMAFSQTDTVKSTLAEEGDVLIRVDQMPEFPGGENELLKYLGSNIKYPATAKDAGVMGTIYMSFVIDEKGDVSRISILRGLKGPGAKECEDEAIRVVKGMPRWTPGQHDGKLVKVQYNLPIKFYLVSGKELRQRKKAEKNK